MSAPTLEMKMVLTAGLWTKFCRMFILSFCEVCPSMKALGSGEGVRGGGGGGGGGAYRCMVLA